MKTSWIPVVAFGLLTATACNGLGSLPGGDCKFATGELSANLKGQPKEFVDAVLEVKKLQLDWDAEIKAMATELKVDPTQEAVLAKLQANFDSFRASGKCTFAFSASVDLQATLQASLSGSASSDDGAKASGLGSADAAVDVDVTIEPKCEAEADVKADLDATITTMRTHLPKMFGIAKSYAEWMAKVPELKTKGEGAVKEVATDINALAECKCAVEALTGLKADIEGKVDFSVKVQASATGEAKAG